MNNRLGGIVDKLLIIAIAAGLVVMVLTAPLLQENQVPGWIAGYLVGMLAIVLHFLQVLISKRLKNDHFFSLYTPMSLARLMIVLLIFIVLLIWEKFDQFSFTVSFLISYIYHSVINIYLINKN